jgi:transcriptional antiterminator RfaH
VGSLSELPGRWWVGHTKARFEKAFAWDLLSHDVGYFLPMTERVTFSGGRRRRVTVPLFPSYVFFCGTERDRCVALTTHRLCRAIDVVDQRQLVRELLPIEAAIRSGERVVSYQFAQPGRLCRVTSGPLAGSEGTVVFAPKGARLTLKVSILGQFVAVEIDADLLEPVT